MFGPFKNKSEKAGLKFRSSSDVVGENIIVATITLQDFVEAILGGVLVDYENNRGNGKLNSTKVRNIAENYDPNKLGVVTVADWRDGTYKKADAHHRTAAIIAKYLGKDGIAQFTSEQLEQNVSLHLIHKEDFIRVYSGLNSNNGHSSRQKALNTDLGLGSMIQEILELQEEDSVVLEKFYTTVARCVYGHVGAFDNATKNISYADLSKDRKMVSAEAGLSKEEFDMGLTDSQKETVADALDYVNKTYAQFKTLNNLNNNGSKVKLNQTARSILRNAGLFGFILWDRLSGRRIITHMKPKDLALRITEKDAQIERQAKFILNSESRDSAAEKIVAYVNTKKRI